MRLMEDKEIKNKEMNNMREIIKIKKWIKDVANFLGINIIIFLIGAFIGVVAWYVDIDILAKLAIVIMDVSTILDGKGNIRLFK